MSGTRKKEPEAPPHDINMIYWQWSSGVIALLNEREKLELMLNPITLAHVQSLLDRKLQSVIDVFKREPDFTLKAEQNPKGVFELKKVMK